MLWAEIIVYGAGLYAASGVAFAVWFVLFGAAKLDQAARGASLWFRLIIFPGAAAFWWLLLWRIWRGKRRPAERNAHRRAAEK